MGAHRGTPLFGDPSAKGLVALMDEVGIKQCLCSAMVAVGPDFQFGNEMIHRAMVDYPGRFFGMCVVDPNYPDEIVPELEKRLRQGFAGVKIHPYCHHRTADDERYHIMYRYAHEHRLIVKSHTYCDGSYGNLVNDPDLFDELARQYPRATFILGHSGGAPRGHDKSIRAAKRRKNIYLEMCSTLAFTAHWLKKSVDAVGDERVFYGSDMPDYDPRAALGIVLFARIPDKSKERILGLNVKRLLDETAKASRTPRKKRGTAK
jgi:predicted TIM-barrel fold metal-dependent hydrolase